MNSIGFLILSCAVFETCLLLSCLVAFFFLVRASRREIENQRKFMSDMFDRLMAKTLEEFKISSVHRPTDIQVVETRGDFEAWVEEQRRKGFDLNPDELAAQKRLAANSGDVHE